MSAHTFTWKSLKILFTSDHQIKPMVAANLQKVREIAGAIDAIFFAGDAVNHADSASEWFDTTSGGSFFPCFQGKSHRQLGKVAYTGGCLLQYAPLFTAVGNHEIMGRFSMHKSLDAPFRDPYPKEIPHKDYHRLIADSTHSEQCAAWVKAHSFNTDSYEEISSLPII